MEAIKQIEKEEKWEIQKMASSGKINTLDALNLIRSQEQNIHTSKPLKTNNITSKKLHLAKPQDKLFNFL